MNIMGIGVVFSGGRGIEQYENALRKGLINPSYSVAPEVLADKKIRSKMRRGDRFSKMAVAAAIDAVEASKISTDSLGIIISTGFGPQVTTFKFLDGIIDYGPKLASPTEFSNSVHNAAASYVSTVLESKGPTLTLTDFSFPFHNSLLIAKSWLNQNRCKNVLVGGIDERGEVMDYICKNKLSIGKIKPFGEGSLFLALSNSKGNNQYCKIDDISVGAKKKDSADVYIVDFDGMIDNGKKYQKLTGPSDSVRGYSSIFGAMINGSAFNCAAGALMIKNQIKSAQINKIQCLKYGCRDKLATINLKK